MSGERWSVYRHGRQPCADATGRASVYFQGMELEVRGASSWGAKRRLLLPPAMHSSVPPRQGTSLKRPPHHQHHHHLRQHLYLRRPPSTSLGLHNKKLTELMCQSLLANPPPPTTTPPPAPEELGLCLIHRRPPSESPPPTPPLHTAHSTSLGPGVLPGVPFGKRCQRDNMDVSWWWWVGGVWGSGQRQPHQPQFNSLYSNYCSPLLPPPAIARLYQAARPRR